MVYPYHGAPVANFQHIPVSPFRYYTATCKLVSAGASVADMGAQASVFMYKNIFENWSRASLIAIFLNSRRPTVLPL